MEAVARADHRHATPHPLPLRRQSQPARAVLVRGDQGQPDALDRAAGPYYSSGLVEADKVLYATQQLDWTWNVNGLFAGLAGIAYSTDLGQTWNFPAKPFPAPLGNLSWVIRGQGGNYTDGYVNAIGTEREFNATNVIMGRSRPDPGSMTDPSQWQWVSGWTRQGGVPWPTFSSALTDAVPIASWPGHITYPQMAYDAPLHQYLLSNTA